MSDAYERLKSELHRVGVSLRSISRDAGVSHTAVTDVARGARRSRRIEKLIADHLEKQPSQLWPERYQDDVGDT